MTCSGISKSPFDNAADSVKRKASPRYLCPVCKCIKETSVLQSNTPLLIPLLLSQALGAVWVDTDTSWLLPGSQLDQRPVDGEQLSKLASLLLLLWCSSLGSFGSELSLDLSIVFGLLQAFGTRWVDALSRLLTGSEFDHAPVEGVQLVGELAAEGLLLDGGGGYGWCSDWSCDGWDRAGGSG